MLGLWWGWRESVGGFVRCSDEILIDGEERENGLNVVVSLTNACFFTVVCLSVCLALASRHP